MSKEFTEIALKLVTATTISSIGASAVILLSPPENPPPLTITSDPIERSFWNSPRVIAQDQEINHLLPIIFRGESSGYTRELLLYPDGDSNYITTLLAGRSRNASAIAFRDMHTGEITALFEGYHVRRYSNLERPNLQWIDGLLRIQGAFNEDPDINFYLLDPETNNYISLSGNQ